FATLFCTLAWLAHWSFGPSKSAFATFQISLNTCFQMLVGEFPFGDDWTESWHQKIWYCCYTFLVFFVSVNIMLAIIVEAFLKVKATNDTNTSEANALIDLGALFARHALGISYDWPSNKHLLRHLKVTLMLKNDVTPEELAASRFAGFQNRNQASKLLAFYYKLMGNAILGDRGQEIRRSQMGKREQGLFVMHLLQAGKSDVNGIIRSVMAVQRAWRRFKAHKSRRIQNASKVAVQQARTASFGLAAESPESPATKLESRRLARCFGSGESWKVDSEETKHRAAAWTAEQVQQWLVEDPTGPALPRELGEKLLQEEVDGATLLSLTELDLQLVMVGSATLGKRRKLLDAVKELQNEAQDEADLPIGKLII
ncbi:unnamed protein product, partial [Polarella glacialis]